MSHQYNETILDFDVPEIESLIYYSRGQRDERANWLSKSQNF